LSADEVGYSKPFLIISNWKNTEYRRSCWKKKTKRKSESSKSSKNGTKFLPEIINFILTREIGKYSENRN
jgi:hypothetical protein